MASFFSKESFGGKALVGSLESRWDASYFDVVVKNAVPLTPAAFHPSATYTQDSGRFTFSILTSIVFRRTSNAPRQPSAA